MPGTFRSDVQQAQTSTPPRVAPSIRRTGSVDIAHDGATLVLTGQCRDLVTSDDGARTAASAELHARLAPGHVLESLECSQEQDAVARLVGLRVGRGFRAAVIDAVPDHHRDVSPLFVLLDELPVAALISGFGLMYSGALGNVRLDGGNMKSDICSGWANDGVMMTSIRATGHMPTPLGPEAPTLEPLDDPESWHPLVPLGPGTMRRRRLVDVHVGEQLEVFAMFRDSHVGTSPDDVELILHEYSVRATVDRTTGLVLTCEATPQVLPWNECPSAAASAGRLVGLHVDELRVMVARDFRGLGTCTHLNDLLRSLGDLHVLAPVVDSGFAAR